MFTLYTFTDHYQEYLIVYEFMTNTPAPVTTPRKKRANLLKSTSNLYLATNFLESVENLEQVKLPPDDRKLCGANCNSTLYAE